MEHLDENTATNEIGDSPKTSTLPSAWLAFYSCTFLLGGLYLARLVWKETTLFPILTTFLATAALGAGILLWLQKRVALKLYIAIACGIIVFAAYRFAFEGYTSGRVGMLIGGLLMFAGYSSVSEELPIAGHKSGKDGC